MTTQNYLMIENGVVDNICVWDGDVNTWTPPANTTMLIQASTPAILWEPITVNKQVTDWVLTEVIGDGAIGFTYNGTAVITNQAKPIVPVQPTTVGTQTI